MLISRRSVARQEAINQEIRWYRATCRSDVYGASHGAYIQASLSLCILYVGGSAAQPGIYSSILQEAKISLVRRCLIHHSHVSNGQYNPTRWPMLE